jgi:ATP-binding cassette subfamily C protein
MKGSDVRMLRQFVAALVASSPVQVAAYLGLVLVASLMEGVGVLVLVPLLALVGVDAGGGALGRVAAGFSTAFAAVGVKPTLPIVLVVYMGVTALQGLLQRWELMLDVGIRQEFVRALRDRVYAAIAAARWEFLARVRSSEAVHILTQELDRVRLSSVHLAGIVVSSAAAIVYFAIAMRVAPAITSVVVVSGAVLAFAVRGAMGRTRILGEAWSESSDRVAAALTEHLAGMKTAKSYGIADRHAEIFSRLSREEREVHLRSARVLASVRQRLALGVPIVLAGVVYISYGVLGVPTAHLFLLLFMFARLMPRVTSLYESAQSFVITFPAFEALMAFEARCLVAAEAPVGHFEPIAMRDRVRFDRVTFDYRGDGAAVAVRDVSLDIEAGQTTAIVGPSGAGKSTLVDLLTGLLAPTTGRVLVDGKPLRSEHLKAWRDQIGYVPQDSFFFHDSVRANLLWANPDATEADLWQAIMAASADFVRALPEGLDTIIGDRGVLISGGERQRLGLARALVRRPSILILDEATSSVDSENEARIQNAIDDLHEQVTIVIVTHRLSTVRRANGIHVVEQGRLVESGTWNELVSRERGRFCELCSAQGIHDLMATAVPATVLSE